MRHRILALAAAAATVAAGLPAVADLGPVTLPTGASSPLGASLAAARDASPVVLTGAQIPGWAAPAAEGVAKPQPSGANSDNPIGDEVRTAHNGTLTVPATPPGVVHVRPDQVAAYAWNGEWWKPIRVQVDQRYPYFLANGHSGFGFYSGTDEELTYDWASDRHAVGEESWKAMFGECDSRFASSTAEVRKAIDQGWLSLGPQENAADYLKSMRDPQPLFDTDDELSFQARDAGAKAPWGTPPPNGSMSGQVVRVVDPLRPGVERYVYLFQKPGGSKFGAADGYVQLTRDPGSTRWVDRYAFDDADPGKIGTSNTGYGPNLPGTVCDTSTENLTRFGITDPTAPRPSTDRQPHDSFTVTTPTYRLHATGRWLVQDLRVRRPGAAAADTDPYGKNIIARWKGRAFQQNPDSDVSLVGFEDEQVNWEMNSALLGWRQGPVRAIREVWGADSGTNVTKTETYYRDADAYAYHVRVHPIPPDGLYTDWSYRPGVATTYYNVLQQNGVAIDGQEDTSGNEVDEVNGRKVYVNSCDPKFTVCSAIDNPEEVAGDGFGLVYEFELTSPTGAAGNSAVVPYYRDDACFDDGTGDAPVPRPWPGESSTDPNDSRVRDGYVAYWQKYWDSHPEVQGFPRPATYDDLKCQPQLAVHGDPTANPDTPPWQIMPVSGAIGEHGIHFFVTQDSDNAFGPKNVDEIDGQQWRFSVPMDQPTNVTTEYGANVSAKLMAVVKPFG